MKNFENITIVSVTGHQSFAQGALKSIATSCNKLPGSRGVLVCPEALPELPHGVQQHQVKTFGYQEYTLFMIYALHHYIETEYLIIVQDDGWILDTASWTDEFYKYDYIGAPVHLAYVEQPVTASWMRGFQWTQHVGQPQTKVTFIQNGGFSFRSKRFMQLPSLLKIPFTIPAPSGLQGNPAALFWPTDEHLEDVQLCVTMRAQLEAHGMKFAPLDVAKKFAIEHAGGGLHSVEDIQHVLGHHSKLRKIRTNQDIDYLIKESELAQVYGEMEICNMLRSKGYRLHFKAESA